MRNQYTVKGFCD